ncbi:MAG: CIA30 family protein [Bacteroidota bacterium]
MIGIIFLLLFSTSFDAPYKIDFGQKLDGRNWRVINDGVMGGLSQGSAYLTEEGLNFQGRISLDNNGGFASLRSPYQNFDLSSFKEVLIRYRAKGLKLGFRLELNRAFYLPYFKTDLQTSEGEWITQMLPLKEFEEYRLGKQTGPTITNPELARIIRIGFVCAEKKEGDFEIEIDFIEFR